MNKYGFNVGDVVYFMEKDGHTVNVGHGIVDDIFNGSLRIEFLDLMETRILDGISIEEYKFPSKKKKLPKGWTYDTKLYELKWKPYPSEFSKLIPSKPEDILYGLEKGYLVYKKNKMYGTVETIVEKDGYYIYFNHNIKVLTNTTLPYDKCYHTYEEALKEVHDYRAEQERISNLSDEEWSIEEIDKTLDRWSKIYSIVDEEKNKVREFLMNLKNIEDVETRLFGGNVQWKYWKNKKWNNICVI